MESTAGRSSVDLAGRQTHAVLALVLALISVPGSTVAWDLFEAGGFVLGFPPAIAAVVLGLQVRKRGAAGQGKALAAIVIGGAMLAMMIVWLIVESVS